MWPLNRWSHVRLQWAHDGLFGWFVGGRGLCRRRASRERDIVAATRMLFDERGLQDARVDDIARAAGLNKALIYRAFSSKDEIFALTATSYLDELRTLTDEAELIDDGVERLRES